VYSIYASGSVGKCPFDSNTPPVVYAGPDFAISSPTNTALLNGVVTDDGRPVGSTLQILWSAVSGPGAVNFNSPTSAVSSVTFATNGIYVLQLTANDGEAQSSDMVEVRVGVSCQVQGISGLEAWWPGNGTPEDVISGNEAILGSGTSYTNGEVALAFNFDGVADYVWMPATTNDSFNLGTNTAGLTMEFWMNPNSFQNGSVLGWANGVRLERYGNNWNGAGLRCFLGAGGQYVQTASYVWNNTNWAWTHVAVTYDHTSGLANIYVNGVLAGTANVGTSIISTAGDFYLGQVPGSQAYYSGQLDEISLYNRPLAAGEVASIFASGSTGKCPANLNLIVNQSPVITLANPAIIDWPTNQLVLNGVVTDDGLPFGGSLNTRWSEVSGPGSVSFLTPATSLPLNGLAVTNPVSTSATFSAPGLYVLQLTADDTLTTNTAGVTVTVNLPPVVNAGINQLIAFGRPASLLGTVQDDGLPVGAVVTNEWVQVSGPGTAKFAHAELPATTVTFTKPGTYQLELLAGDTSAVSSNTVTVTMAQFGSNQPPTVYAGPDQTIGGTNLAVLSGVVFDDNFFGTGYLYSWWAVQSGPGTVTFANSNAPATTALFSAPGTYVLKLSANDSQYTSSSQVAINIYPTFQPPTVYPGPAQSISNSTTELPGVVTDADLPAGTPLTVHWSQISGPGTAFFAVPSSADTMVSFSQSGAYVLQLSANNTQFTVSSNVTVNVGFNQAPIVYAGPNQEIDNTNSTTLQGYATDDGLPLGSTLQTTWSLVSGPNTAVFSDVHATNATVTFGDLGSYQLQLTATDGQLTTSNDVTIIVTASNSIPYQSTNDLYRFVTTIGDVTNFYVTNFDESTFTNGRAGFGSYGACISCGLNNPTFVHTHWPGADGGVPELLIRRHFYVPPGTTNLSMGFTVDNNAEIYINGVLVTDASAAQDIYNGGFSYSAPWFVHGGCPNYDDLILAGLSTNLWHPGYNLLAVRAQDGGCECFFDCRISPNGGVNVLLNQPPMPQVNTNQFVVYPAILPLTASVQDDGLPLNAPYKTATWSQISGPGTATFSQPTSSFLTNNDASTMAAFSQPGTYVLQLTADDSDLSESVDVTVLVSSVSNQPPVVSAGPDQTIAQDSSAVLNGVATDDGLPFGTLTTSWSAESGPGNVSFVTLNGTNYASFSAVGDYVLQFSATDGAATNSANMTVHVLPPVSRSFNMTTSYPTQTDVSVGANLSGEIYDAGLAAGNVLTDEWVTVSGPGQAVFTQGANNFPAVSVHADFPAAGSYVLRLVAGDGQLSGNVDMPITVTDLYHGNRPPGVNAGPAMAAPVNVPVSLSGSAIDNDVTAGGTLTTLWTESSGPTSVTFANASVTNTTVTFSAPGNYVLELTASDGQLFSSSSVTVVATNTASSSLLVYAGGSTTLVLPDTLEMDGVVLDENPSMTLSYQWTNLSGPGPVTFTTTNIPAIVSTNATAWLPVENSEAVAIATFSVPGNYVLQLSGTDGQVTNSDTLAVTVVEPTNTAPVVNAGSPQTIVLPNVAALHPVVTDDGLPNGTLNLAWTQVSGPGTATVSQFDGGYYASFSAAGVYDLQLTANDGQLSATNDVIITVYDAISAPNVAITAPGDAAIITAPTNIIGTADSPILQSYQLQYRFKNPDGAAPNAWVTFANGTTSVDNGVLGTLDPTIMLNGIYEMQLVAIDSSGQSSATDIQTFSVERNLKIGQFSLSFQDLNVPVSGIPIQIVRTYDSRDQRTDDFGVGWSLDIRNIQLQKTRSLGPNWFQDYYYDPLFDQYALDPIQPREITVTLAGSKVYHFQAVVTPTQQYFYPIEDVHMSFTNMPGTYGGLAIDGDDEATVDSPLGYANLINLDDFSYFNPTRFRFTNEVGDVYIIDEKTGLQSLTDRSQNTLVINSNGVVWTNALTGNSGVGVSFVRDDQGRITQIIDPNGGALNYTYGTNGSLSAFTDRATNTTTFDYTNANFPNYLTSVTDPRGNQAVRTIYDDSGRMIQQIDPDGNAISFNHDFSNSRDIITDTLGYTTVNYYDDRGNILATIDALGNITQFQYDDVDNLLKKIDALGNTNSYTYDSQGNKITETDPLGYITSYTYGPYRELTSVATPRGYTTTNVYDPNSGKITQQIDPFNNVTTYSYDGAGNLLARVDALGNAVNNYYDSGGRVILRTTVDMQRGLLSSNSFTYDKNGNQTSQTIARSTTHGLEALLTQFTYDEQNRLIQTIQADGAVSRTIYTVGLDKPAVEIDPMGRQTFHFYDERGNETNTIFADNTHISTAYDTENRKISTTDRAGYITFFTNDALGRLTATRMPDGAVSQTVYDADGRAIITENENGKKTFYGYDADGRNTSITNALGQITTFGYDQSGNRTEIIDADGRTNQAVYDGLNRKIEVIFPDGTSSATAYDAMGRQTAEIDQNTNTTWFAYDALDRLVAVTNAFGRAICYGYDEMGSLISQTDANNHTTTYEYDSLGRRTKLSLPAGQSEIYAYDSAGNLTNKVDFNGHVATFTYDTQNRLLAKIPDTYFGVPTVTMTYTATGQRATMTDASGQTVYLYNSRGWLTNKTETWTTGISRSPRIASLNYSYDAYGNVTHIASSEANGVNVGYSYDPLNRLQIVNDSQTGTTTYGYDSVGNLTGCIYPNNINSSYAYDSLNRLTNLVTLNSQLASVAFDRYTVAAGGQRLTANENIVLTNGVRTINRLYTYDATYRLTHEGLSVTDPVALPVAADVGYTLDNVGNRLARDSTLGGVPSIASSFDANDRINSDTYDSNGNTISGSTSSSAYTVGASPAVLRSNFDFEDRLVTATNANGAIITITYDGDGNRVSKTVTTVTNVVATFYLVDELNPSGYAEVLEEFTSINSQPSALNRVYVYGQALISQTLINPITQSASIISYYGYDGHGNVRYLTDINGNLTDIYDYDAFGNLIDSTGVTPNKYLYCDEQFDSDIGLYYNRARYLNTDSGRFWSKDKYDGDSQSPLSLHRYLYTRCDPINNFDPSGFDLSDALFGTYVHQQIGLDFLSRYTGTYSQDGVLILSNVAVNRSIGRGVANRPATRGTDFALRPDLVNIDSGEVYEIKPEGSFGQGVDQLNNYLEILRTVKSDVNWHAGTSFIPKTPIPVLLSPVNVDPPIDGVIIYHFPQNPDGTPIPIIVPVWKMADESEQVAEKEIEGNIAVEEVEPAY
jgi:RHS repeat-associated protein